MSFSRGEFLSGRGEAGRGVQRHSAPPRKGEGVEFRIGSGLSHGNTGEGSLTP